MRAAVGAQGEVAVRVRGLVKRYGSLVAVDGIDFEVRRGTTLAVLGPNGAGKTTTIEILEGLQEPDAGEVEVLGLRWAEAEREIRMRIGVQLQETVLQDKLTVLELLRMFRSFYERGRDLGDVLRLVGLEEKRDVHVTKLSGGQRQRLGLGCALLSAPDVLFLDEPTTGLDPQARRRVWGVVEEFRAEGGTTLLTTHYMEEAERLADDLLVVDRGRVIARGSPSALIASLGAEGVVELDLGEDAGEPPSLEELAVLPGVRAARRAGRSIVLSVTETQRSIGALLAHLDARGIALQDLRTHRPTLEDVFVSLTGKHLRDE